MAVALKEQWRLFADEFMETHNATRSYMKAYPLCSYEAARRNASVLLTHPDIRAYITQARKEIAEVFIVQQHDITRGFAELAFTDIADAFDENGNLKRIGDIPKELRSRITGVEVDGNVNEDGSVFTTKKIKFGGKESALEQLGRHLGYFEKDKVSRQQIDLNVRQIATVYVVPAFVSDADDVSQPGNNGADH
jgi:phage terminase small subunit